MTCKQALSNRCNRYTLISLVDYTISRGRFAPKPFGKTARSFAVLRLHLPLSGSLLEATFAKCSPYSNDEKICGLRPRIK